MPDTPHHNPTPGSPAPGGSGAGDSGELSAAEIRCLSEADGMALDAVLAARAAGADRGQGPVPAGSADRAEKARELLGLLELAIPDDPSADLTARTLQVVRAHEQRQRFAQQVQMLSEPRRSLGVAWHQLVTAAAVFIIGTALLMPVMDRQQADSRRLAGASNLRLAGQAMSKYSSDNLGQMPRGDIRPGMVWWDVGQPQEVGQQGTRSNSAQLYRLVRQGYITADHLACPENPHARRFALTAEYHDWTDPRSVSFSYQNQYTSKLLRMDDAPGMAVLADRNPLFIIKNGRVAFNAAVPRDASSMVHRRPGQNVLTADGVVTWRVRPILDPLAGDGGDNIWTITGIDFYTGREVRDNPNDSFLAY